MVLEYNKPFPYTRTQDVETGQLGLEFICSRNTGHRMGSYINKDHASHALSNELAIVLSHYDD